VYYVKYSTGFETCQKQHIQKVENKLLQTKQTTTIKTRTET